MTTLHIMN